MCAGLLVGERGPTDAMSETTQHYLVTHRCHRGYCFIPPDRSRGTRSSTESWIDICSIVAVLIVLAARWISVAVPITALQLKMPFMKGTIPVLTWGGVRGGISIALVLSIPDFEQRSIILAATYVVVVFSVVIQGLTLARLVRSVVPPKHQG